MDIGEPSRTAQATAYARAYHQVADEPRIFTDPLAARLLGVTDAELVELDTATMDHPGHAGASNQPRRMFLAARARFAEDAVAAAAGAGVRQVVILGAGLDTFAYRNPYPDLHVFEVDHPATQTWKRERLAAAGIDLPETLTFVPVDFETQTLGKELESAGLDRSAPAVFVWLGVIFYLTADAIGSTLEYVAGQGGSSELIFDYLQPAESDEDRAAMRARAERLAVFGEPWFSFFAPDEIAGRLRSLGFTRIEDHWAPDLVAAYLDGFDPTAESPAQVLRSSRILRASR